MVDPNTTTLILTLGGLGMLLLFLVVTMAIQAGYFRAKKGSNVADMPMSRRMSWTMFIMTVIAATISIILAEMILELFLKPLLG